MKVVVFDYLGSIDPDSVGAVMDVGTWQAQPGIADAIAHLNHLESQGALSRQVDANGLIRFTPCHQACPK